jgi:1,4-alpha-glucan branching enzyme
LRNPAFFEPDFFTLKNLTNMLILKSTKMKSINVFIIMLLSVLLLTCKPQPEQVEINHSKAGISQVNHVEWSKDAVIYEVNVRQYTPEGTFKAFEKDLSRLKEMGVDIIWVMPINPIGKKNRKGPLGSYYSVRDYKAINPEFGTIADFKDLVKAVHNQGMKIIIDWVPNHSSWDNNLVKEHPEFYLKDSVGKFVSPFDWTDVIRFDYGNKEMRKYMITTMQGWLTETDIDGFRCDVAHMVPVDFWDELRPELEKVKPVFMLAEADQPELHRKAFDMTYDWKLHHIFNEIAKSKEPAYAIAEHYQWVDSVYPENSYLMQFTSNHDENSWNGTEFERMGQGAKAFAVLAATLPDMLLIYNGQESAFNERLKFFEKDTINWADYNYSGFYETLAEFKEKNRALFNGSEGGELIVLSSPADSNIFAFMRKEGDDQVLVICNLGDTPVNYKLYSNQKLGELKELFTGSTTTFKRKTKIALDPWQYCVYSN